MKQQIEFLKIEKGLDRYINKKCITTSNLNSFDEFFEGLKTYLNDPDKKTIIQTLWFQGRLYNEDKKIPTILSFLKEQEYYVRFKSK